MILASILTLRALLPCCCRLTVANCGHVDDGLSGETPWRIAVRGLLVYRAWLVGSHKPWASKEEKYHGIRLWFLSCSLCRALPLVVFVAPHQVMFVMVVWRLLSQVCL